jgi:Fe-S-cluster containining protein
MLRARGVTQYPYSMRAIRLPPGDQKLVQIMDAALADAGRRSGSWLVCRPGCTQCCMGVFAITQLDAARLQHGLVELEEHDPQRAASVRDRARDAVVRLSPEFPGDRTTGILSDDETAEHRFEDFANDEPCPVLDPAKGTCDLYASRPLTCRAFGPPVRSDDGLGVCELCFHGASDEQIVACEMEVDPDDLESKLLEEMQSQGSPSGRTIVAFALAE